MYHSTKEVSSSTEGVTVTNRVDIQGVLTTQLRLFCVFSLSAVFPFLFCPAHIYGLQKKIFAKSKAFGIITQISAQTDNTFLAFIVEDFNRRTLFVVFIRL